MSFKQFLYSEMPITNFELLGKWGPESKRLYGYNRQDIGILTNPRAVEKIHKLWSNTDFDFDFYFLRSKEAYTKREIGQVDTKWVKDNLGIEIEPRPDTITIIFTNNTGTEKIPMTAWAIAHRLGHAIRREGIFDVYLMKEVENDFKELLKHAYGLSTNYQRFSNEKELRALAHAVGTMKSATRGKLVNFYEFVYEIVAQYIVTGHVRFNDLPKNLPLDKKMAWGKPNNTYRRFMGNEEEYTEWNEMLHNHAQKYEHYIHDIFGGLLNKIFVM